MKGLIVLLVLLLAGCHSQAEGFVLVGRAPQAISEWPSNEFTEELPQPQSGQMDYVYDYSEAGRYMIFITDLTRAEAEAYVQELEEQGFHRTFSDSNNASGGVMLANDTTQLNIAYSNGGMGIWITK